MESLREQVNNAIKSWETNLCVLREPRETLDASAEVKRARRETSLLEQYNTALRNADPDSVPNFRFLTANVPAQDNCKQYVLWPHHKLT